MFDFFSQEKIDWFSRVLLAQVVIFFLFMLGLVSFSIPMSGEVRPFFILMALYYWAIYRPSLLHPFFVFIYGIIFDLILGFPLGIHAVLFLLVQWVIKSQRLFFMGQTYLVVWIGFSLTVLSVLSVEWIFFSALAGAWLNLTSILTGFVMTSLLFPLITLMFIVVHKILPVTQKPYL